MEVVPEMVLVGPGWNYFRLEPLQFRLEFLAQKASAACCGVNLALQMWGGLEVVPEMVLVGAGWNYFRLKVILFWVAERGGNRR